MTDLTYKGKQLVEFSIAELKAILGSFDQVEQEWKERHKRPELVERFKDKLKPTINPEFQKLQAAIKLELAKRVN